MIAKYSSQLLYPKTKPNRTNQVM